MATVNVAPQAKEKGIVPAMIDAAANANIETHPVRCNVSVLERIGRQYRCSDRQ